MGISIDVSGTIAGLDALGARVDGALRDSVEDALHIFQLAARAEAPIGTEGNTTNPPGDLSRSIEVEGPEGGEGLYAGRVGPTTVYGRQRELGGDIYPGLFARSIGAIDHPGGTGREEGSPLLVFSRFGQLIFSRHVYQVGAHYMLRAYHGSMDAVEGVTDSRIAAAIVGY